MKIDEETTVSEEQVLFNKLNWETQRMILGIMRCLQPCELSCEAEEEKKIPEKFDPCIGGIMSFESVENIFSIFRDEINEIIDYLKNKGE